MQTLKSLRKIGLVDIEGLLCACSKVGNKVKSRLVKLGLLTSRKSIQQNDLAIDKSQIECEENHNSGESMMRASTILTSTFLVFQSSSSRQAHSMTFGSTHSKRG